MDRRELLSTTGGVAAPTAVASAPARADGAGEAAAAPYIGTGARELGLAMPWRDNGRGFGDSARRLARRIEALTDGRFRIAMTSGSDGATAELTHASAH